MLRLFFAGKRFSTKLSELGHSAERQALESRGPGKNFVPHSQRDVLAKFLVTHKSLGGDDPTERIRMRKGLDNTAAAVVDATDPFCNFLPQHIIEETCQLKDCFG